LRVPRLGEETLGMPLIESTFNMALRRHIRALMYEAEVTPIQMAEALNLSRNTMYGRLRGVAPFTTDEVQIVADVLHIDIIDIWPMSEAS